MKYDFYGALTKLNEIYNLEEAAADKQRFINKFGEKTFDYFNRAKDRLKNSGYSTDITWYTANMRAEELNNLIQSLYNKETDKQQLRRIQGLDKEIRGKYEYLGNMQGFEVYRPLDYLASMDLGVNTGWCTTGRFGHAGHPEYTPDEKAAQSHFSSYTSNGKVFYYLLDPETFYGKYAIVLSTHGHTDWDKTDVKIDSNGNGKAEHYNLRYPSSYARIDSIWNAQDKNITDYEPDSVAIVADDIVKKYNSEHQQTNTGPTKEPTMTNPVFNFFELWANNCIVEYYGDFKNNTKLVIPLEAQEINEIVIQKFKENKDSIESIACNPDTSSAVFRKIPKTIKIIDSESGEILSAPLPKDEYKGTYFIDCFYDSGRSLNRRTFIVSSVQNLQDKVKVVGAGTDEHFEINRVVLFNSKEEAQNFMNNFYDSRKDKLKPHTSYKYTIDEIEYKSRPNAIKNLFNNAVHRDEFVEVDTQFGKALVNRKYIKEEN